VIRLAVIDDATLVRVGFEAALSGDPNITLVATATSAAEARELVPQVEPDVVALDASLADGDGLSLGEELRAARPWLGVVLMARLDDDLVFRALEAGLSAVVPRHSTVDRLVAAIRHAAVSPTSFTAPDLGGTIARRRARLAVLSPRETEVLRCLGGGLGVTAIAHTLQVTESTVRTYVVRLCHKLGATNRSQMLTLAAQQHLLPDRVRSG
jgi:DNA-binding NarL/FixJ family response regulator